MTNKEVPVPSTQLSVAVTHTPCWQTSPWTQNLCFLMLRDMIMWPLSICVECVLHKLFSCMVLDMYNRTNRIVFIQFLLSRFITFWRCSFYKISLSWVAPLIISFWLCKPRFNSKEGNRWWKKWYWGRFNCSSSHSTNALCALSWRAGTVGHRNKDSVTLHLQLNYKIASCRYLEFRHFDEID